jgi:hypothetical protein
MYWTYVVYGIAVLGAYNCILSSLDYFIEQMPGYNPSFWVGLGLNFMVCFAMSFVMVYGGLCSFSCRNHVMQLLQVPLTLSLPIFANFLKTPKHRFIAYVINMNVIGGVNSVQNASLYG